MNLSPNQKNYMEINMTTRKWNTSMHVQRFVLYAIYTESFGLHHQTTYKIEAVGNVGWKRGVLKGEKRRKVNIMEDLLFNKVLGGEELVKDILNTDNVSSIRDQTGKSYWWNTIDKKKKYQVEKYEYERALQYYPVISYIIKEVI